MVRIDENQEAIACIRMDIDAADAELKIQAIEVDATELKEVRRDQQTAQVLQGHWKLGSPQKHTTTKHVEAKFENDRAFRGFQKNLFAYLHKNLPGEKISGIPLKVCRYYCK
jgi:hypothetical protein